jgi:XTP/dITP diphosphohydrolase
MRELLIATTNKGKVAELAEAFAGLSVRLISLVDIAKIHEVEESGETFTENAVLKAIGYAKQAGIPTIADDSGLEIDALGGRPGVMSARYGGDVGYDVKIARLLEEMGTDTARTARFKCAIAFASPIGELIASVEEKCEGRIALSPRGERGFGYDPVFIPDGFHETFAELPDEIKREISHRARATSKIIPYLRDFIAVST